MGRKVIAVGLSIVLLGLAMVACSTAVASEPPGAIQVQGEKGNVTEIVPIMAERQGNLRLVNSLGVWTLNKLGYSDLVFPCQEPYEAMQIEYMLPKNAAQGPKSWYILHLHFSIKFSEESEVTGGFPYERTYVEASTGAPDDSYPCAMIKFMNQERDDGQIVIDWNIGSENLLGGESSWSSTSLNIEDVRFENYLRTSGVWPGRNVLTFTLTQYDGAKVESLTIFADSGIKYTSEPNPMWEESWGEQEMPPGFEAPTKLTEEQKAKTLDIALNDSRVQELLQKKNYTILEIASDDYSDPPEKSRVVILLDKIYKIEYDWPWPPGRQQHETYVVRFLDIFVNLQEGMVLGISPEPQGSSMRPISPKLASSVSSSSKLPNVANNLRYKTVREDRLYNFDFESQSAVYNNVNCPLDMLFVCNAEVDKVKDIYWGLAGPALFEYYKFDDGAGWKWDSDRGTKEPFVGIECSSLIIPYRILHMRLYAPSPADRLYNDAWGYYVVGTCHLDVCPEPTGGGQAGWSETAEGWFTQYAGDAGYTIRHDNYDFYNQQNGWDQNNGQGTQYAFYWENDGWASVVVVLP